jgi:SAM-dependent methyltransferase
MAELDYEYTGLLAATWDLFRGDTSDWPDRAFYKSVIAESGQPALDVGCATGRLILDYLSDGIDIDGVDVSPVIFGICQ